MMEETLRKEGQSLTKALPMYLAAQVVTLLLTALDSQVYAQAYHIGDHFRVNGWAGAWFVLVIFGLANAVFLLVRTPWRVLFDESTRMKLALGYFLGGLTGMLTLGVRFMPMIPLQYFYVVSGSALLAIGAYFIWKKRAHRVEEIFP